ncbi:MAG: hypothetical protein QOJ65_1669 [Fimbriimonadaceae bacterium]|jgi:hypothetical protein|nr:hypothetical protein [Fimbriimonadaceae bacterium]
MTNSLDMIAAIQQATVDKTETVSNLLRRCIVLAHQTNNSALRNWAEHELNGYKTEDLVPDYRVTTSVIKGNFVGPFGSQMINFSVPPALLPADVREMAGRIEVREQIRSIEHLLESDRAAFRRSAGDLPLMLQNVLVGMTCIGAWYETTRESLETILESARNRILQLMLEIGSGQPSTDELEKIVKSRLYGIDVDQVP